MIKHLLIIILFGGSLTAQSKEEIDKSCLTDLFEEGKLLVVKRDARSIIGYHLGESVIGKNNDTVYSISDFVVVSIIRMPGSRLAVLLQRDSLYLIVSNLSEVFHVSGDLIMTDQAIGIAFQNENELPQVHIRFNVGIKEEPPNLLCTILSYTQN